MGQTQSSKSSMPGARWIAVPVEIIIFVLLVAVLYRLASLNIIPAAIQISLSLLLGLIAAFLSSFIHTIRKIRLTISEKSSLYFDSSQKHSKIKAVFLELSQYAFFHSPYGIRKPDGRFIGRDHLRNRLKALLTQSGAKSGAYLITGFRGMGKTSLVRNVLSEITSASPRFRFGFGYAARILLILLIIKILLHFPFDTQTPVAGQSMLWLQVIIGTLSYIASRVLFALDKRRVNLVSKLIISRTKGPLPNHRKILIETLASMVRLFTFERIHRPGTILGLLSAYVIQITAILAVGSMINILWNPGILVSLLSSWLLGGILVYLFANTLLDFLNEKSLKFSEPDESSGTQKSPDAPANPDANAQTSAGPETHKPGFFIRLIRSVVAGFGRIRKGIFDHLNNSHRIPIEVSLAQDDLKELDVLKILSTRMLAAYERILKPFFSVHRTIWWAAGWMIVVMLAAFVVFNAYTYPIQLDLKQRLGVGRYFPSQVADFRNGDKSVAFSFFQEFYPAEKTDSNDPTKNDSLVKERVTDRDSARTAAYVKSLTGEEVNLETISRLRLACITLDYWLQVRLRTIFHHPERPLFRDTSLTYSSAFSFPAFLLDFSFLIVLLVLVVLSNWMRRRTEWIGITNHHSILRRLRELNQSLESEITLNKSGAVGSRQGLFSLFQLRAAKTRRIPIAGYRQVEEELIEILSDLDKLPMISIRPEFIFVFDELDKIQSEYSPGMAEKESSEIGSFFKDEEGMSGLNVVRKRKAAIERILGNLKRFFSTAQAKFIFIAGREMYDAALADASDREAFISTIFHEVIYVESFFKDLTNKRLGDLTGLTEQYVCQFLLPDWYINWERQSRPGEDLQPTLLMYNRYLKRELGPTEDAVAQRHKIIYLLQYFITYLMFRSNGSPKKVTNLFEEHIRQMTPIEAHDAVNSLVVGKNDQSLYLSMTFTDQYRFGFSYYLFKPFLIAKVRHMRDLGDQMLVSTTFLLDHIYKYHSSGFSWRHLEQTPEIVSINKTPELRKFLSELFVFFTNNHLEEIVGGLFQFKFNTRISNEISILSKISEREAASMNFTLDESLQLKKHYKRKLNDIRAHYRKTELPSEKETYLNSVAILNGFLGDLYFYDKEYEDALIHYMDALQSIQKDRSYQVTDINSFLKRIRLTLRIGLTYEKMKDYDSAFMAYGRLSKTIRSFSRIGNRDHWITDPDKEPTVQVLDSDGKNYPLTEKYSKEILFEYHRVLYLPILAKLHIIEKASTSQMTAVDVKRALQEAKMLLKLVHPEEKLLIRAEFHRKLSGLLYYKNGRLIGEEGMDKNFLFFQNIDEANKKNLRDYRPPVSAFLQLKESIETQLKLISTFYLKSKKTAPASELEYLKRYSEFYLKSYHEIGFQSKTKTFLLSVANTLSDMGDLLLASTHEISEQSLLQGKSDLMNLFSKQFSEAQNITTLQSLLSASNISSINLVIYYYYLSGQFYKRAARYNKYAFQLKKILILVRDIAYQHFTTGQYSNTSSILSPKFTNAVRDHLVRECLEVTDRASEFTRRQYLYEYEEILAEEFSKSEINKTLFKNSRLNIPESREVIILFNEILLFTGQKSCDKLLQPYSTIVNRITQFWTLNYSVNKNTQEWAQKRLTEVLENALEVGLGSTPSDPNHVIKSFHSHSVSIEILICDSINALTEMLKTAYLADPSYLFNHTMIGDIHHELGDWSRFLHMLQRLELKKDANEEPVEILLNENKEFIHASESRKRLKILIGQNDLQYLDAGYHYKKAEQHYYLALEMHNEGVSYHDNVLNNLYYLEDDYDDDIFHFHAAVERWHINAGDLRKKIVKVKDKTKAVQKFDHKAHFEFPSDASS